MGMGNLSACLSDAWAMTNNIGGLAEIKHVTASATYQAVPSFKAFDRMAVVFAMPVAGGAGGASAFRFGDDLYNEHVLSLGYANTFGLASLGLKANYIQYRAEGLTTRTALTFSFGGLARLTPNLLFGACVININQPTINTTTSEKIPTALLAGIAFRPSDKVIASTEIEKEIEQTPTIKAGLEYRIFNKVALRTGFNFRPESGFAGFGLKFPRIHADYALQLNHVLGLTHQATITCNFRQD